MSLTPRIDKLQRNILINGNLDFWQRGTATTTTVGYLADRFRASVSNISTQLQQAQSGDVPFGDGYSLLLSAAATVTPASGTAAGLIQVVEGNFAAGLNSKKIGITYYVKANHSATYSGFITTGAAVNEAYIWNFTTVANTWVRVDQIVDLTGHTVNGNVTTGTFSFCPVELIADPARVGSTGWNSAATPSKRGTFGQKNFFDTIGNNIRVSKMMIYALEGGDQLVNGNEFIRASHSYSQEFQLCQRYYQKSYVQDTNPGTATSVGSTIFRGGTGSLWYNTPFLVSQRALGTVVLYDWAGNINRVRSNGTNNQTTYTLNTSDRGFDVTSTVSVTELLYQWTADAEL